MIGLAYQLRMDTWFERGRFVPDCLEVSAEPFYKTTRHRLHWLASKFPSIVRCTSLSLGGPDPIDEQQLASCAAIVREADALWLAHPLGFSRAGEVDLGLTVPISLTPSNLQLVCDRVSEVMERCGRRLVIENSSSPLRIHGTIAETEFLNQVCVRSGCKLLVDLSALDVDSVRHRFDAAAWLDAIDPQQIVQMRIAVGPRLHDSEARQSVARQISAAARLLQRAPQAAIILATPQFCPLEHIDRAWSELRAATSSDGRRPGIGVR